MYERNYNYNDDYYQGENFCGRNFPQELHFDDNNQRYFEENFQNDRQMNNYGNNQNNFGFRCWCNCRCHEREDRKPCNCHEREEKRPCHDWEDRKPCNNSHNCQNRCQRRCFFTFRCF